MSSAGNADLCTRVVVVACVEQRVPMADPDRAGAWRTDVALRVARSVRGALTDGELVHVRALGGGPDDTDTLRAGTDTRFDRDACYTLFLAPRPGSDASHVHPRTREVALPARLSGLPAEATLHAAWDATCGANPDGVWSDDPSWQLHAPAGSTHADALALATVFRPPGGVAVSEPGPPMAALACAALVTCALARVLHQTVRRPGRASGD